MTLIEEERWVRRIVDATTGDHPEESVSHILIEFAKEVEQKAVDKYYESPEFKEDMRKAEKDAVDDYLDSNEFVEALDRARDEASEETRKEVEDDFKDDPFIFGSIPCCSCDTVFTKCPVCLIQDEG